MGKQTSYFMVIFWIFLLLQLILQVIYVTSESEIQYYNAFLIIGISFIFLLYNFKKYHIIKQEV